MGRAIALELARAGAAVVLAARRESSWEPVVEEVTERGGTAIGCNTDIADPAACARLAGMAASELGRVDVLVNNAFAEEDWHDPFDGFDVARWREPIDVNVFGTLTLTQACAFHICKAAGGGSIVMITTLSVRNPIPLLAGYAASKSALTTAARVLAAELGPAGIRVNCVAPGHIRGARSTSTSNGSPNSGARLPTQSPTRSRPRIRCTTSLRQKRSRRRCCSSPATCHV